MGEILLSDTDAALKLGITKELLYAYVRNAPKKHLGEQTKLLTIIHEGKNLFREEDLIFFDNYLKTPWSNPGDERPAIPSYIQDYLKVECGGKCPISGKGYPLDNAHIISYSESFSHHHHNLIRIAKEEHTKADNGVIPRKTLQEKKDELIKGIRDRLKGDNDLNKISFKPPLPHFLFVGREAKVLELIEAMEYNRLVIIEGLGGIGKTQLLLNALHNVKYHNPILWIDVENIANLDHLLLSLNTGFTQITGQATNGSFIERIENTTITIILDSLEKLLIPQRDEIEDFIQSIMSKPIQTQIIITSQIDLSILDQEKKIIKLTGLKYEESSILLNEYLQEEIPVPQKHFEELIEFCNGHPLSIKLTTSLLRFFKSSSLTLKQLQETGKLEQPMRNKHTKATALDVCLSAIFECLSDSQIEILQYVKFFPGGIKVFWAENHFKKLTFSTDTAILQQFFFIETDLDQLDFERLIVPNPIRPFLRAKALSTSYTKEKELQKDALLNIMMEAVIIDMKYIETGKEGSPIYGIKRIEDELPNLLNAFEIAQNEISKNNDAKELNNYEEIISGIASALGKFCFTKGDYQYGILFSKAAIAVNLKQKKYGLVSLHYMYLSQIQSRQFDYNGLEITVENMQKLALDTGDHEVKMNAALIKGRLEFDKGNYQVALNYYEQTLKLLEDSEAINNSEINIIEQQDINSIKGNKALILFDIAKIYEYTGEFEIAINKHKEAIEISSFINDEINLGSHYHHIAHCFCELKNYKEGFSYYFKAIERFKAFGLFEYLANSISDLGLYVETNSSIVESSLLNEKTLELALNSLSYQFKDIIQRENKKKEQNEIIEHLPFGLISKTILIIKLIGFSPYRTVLTNWSEKILEQIDIKILRPGLFSAILNLGHAVGGIDYWKNMHEHRPLMIKTILQSCLIINGGPDLKSKSRIFFWLAAWMRYTKLNDNSTAEKLWDEAWASFDN